MPMREGLREAEVTINDYALTFGQVMSLRVAVSSMRISLVDQAFRACLGEELATNYDSHLAAIEQMLIEHGR